MRFWRRKKSEEEPEESPRDDETVALAEAEAAEPEAEADLEHEPEPEFEDEYTEEEREELHQQTEQALQRTRKGLFGRIGGLFTRADFDESLWDELEEILIASDTGLPTTEAILDTIRQEVKDTGVKRGDEVRDILRDELIDILEEPGDTIPAWELADAPKPLIIMVVGVNGAGKTTSIAKLAHAFRADGASVVLGAGDTFRAAAIDQLRIWGERLDVRVVAHQMGADPGAVAFDTIAAAESASSDIVIIDTAGRLHTKTNLMEELKKVSRVMQRKYPEAPHETLLVVDATTGQNGLAQARTFTDAVGVSGIVLAKLDGTAKGGIAFAIAHELGIPVRFIGTGERLGDLAPFDATEFVDTLLG